MSKYSEDIYYFKIFLHFKKIIHGISSQAFGSIKKLSDGVEEYNDTTVRFAKAIGLAADTFVFMEQKHTGNVNCVDTCTSVPVSHSDALVTDTRKVPLAVVTADCLPILLFDPVKEVIAVAHAGYKGLLENIIGNTITRMRFAFGCEPKDIIVGIGPGIEMNCYEVGKDRLELFQKAFPSFRSMYTEIDGKNFLDLRMIAQQCLSKEGILKKHCETMDICTKCDPHFFSFRGGDSEKRFVSMISLV